MQRCAACTGQRRARSVARKRGWRGVARGAHELGAWVPVRPVLVLWARCVSLRVATPDRNDAVDEVACGGREVCGVPLDASLVDHKATIAMLLGHHTIGQFLIHVLPGIESVIREWCHLEAI